MDGKYLVVWDSYCVASGLFVCFGDRKTDQPPIDGDMNWDRQVNNEFRYIQKHLQC